MTIRDDVLAALDADAPKSNADICDETGLDSVQVGNAFTQLKALGKCARGPDGWFLVDEAQNTAPSDAPVAAKPVAAKRVPKPTEPKAARSSLEAAPAVVAVDGALSFALSEACEIVIERRDGSGQRALITRRDALRLADFINRVRPALVDA